MPQQTLLFYDTETTGLNKCFDQVIQFAAIRTDFNLKEISRHEIRIKRNSDVIPSPYAVMTHHIGLEAMKEGVNELDGIKEIHQLLNQPGTISLGYNTLGFDDEFLRFSFYRNLLPPYSHQFANQCGRMDIYPLTILYYLFKKDTANWPMIDGKLSMKLEHIAAANDFLDGNAHDAMVDVEATLELAKLLKRDESMWQYCLGYFDKKTDIQRGDRLPIALETEDKIFREGLIVNGKFGRANQFIVPVISLGQHYHYKNQTLWLRLDQEKFDETSYVIHKKMGEQELLLPPEARYLERIDEDRLKLAQHNKQLLIKNPKLLFELCDHFCDYTYPVVPNIDIDAALYTQSFPTPQEEAVYREFHRTKPQQKMAVADRFSNQARRDQALRIMARHYPDCLNTEDLDEFQDYMDARVVDFRGEPKYNLEKLNCELQEIKSKELSQEQLKLLDEFRLLSKEYTVN